MMGFFWLCLKEFRTQQCPLFLLHKCQQHRPFTCFNWHFLNQRRRRPVRKRDGTFSYSPDVYCTKYDETTGICPDGDDCPYLHRTAGDTERRYHLRYYKTGTCVYETDAKGHCVKNGPHCAFAHGAQDMRPAVYDLQDTQAIDLLEKPSTSPASMDKDKVLAEDPRWNDTSFVLANYKTESCKKPPRLCRQGYACPQFHNSRDRRRSPKVYKYRSTPCPNVKHGDEWGDPSQCDSGDNCAYCHTRTEQQFHPEIYKSTKCNDMVQTSFCPRGAFCAFAHVEQEMTSFRDVISTNDNSLAAFVTNALPSSDMDKIDSGKSHKENGSNHKSGRLPNPIGKERTNSTSSHSSLIPIGLIHAGGLSNNSNGSSSSNGSQYRNSPLPDPFLKGRSSSASSGSDFGMPPLCQRALGLDKEDIQFGILGGGGSQLGTFNHVALSPTVTGSNMSPLAPAFYPPGDCVESVIGKALDDIHLEDFDMSSLDKEMERSDNDSNSVSSSLSAGLSTSGCFGNNGSIPIGIPPGAFQQRGSISSLSQSPPSPFGSFPHSVVPHHIQGKQDCHDQSSSPLLNHPGMKYGIGSNFSDTNSMSPRSTGPQSPMLSNSFSSHFHNGELQRIKDELQLAKSKLAEWEGVYTQAKCACEAWKKEAEESVRKAKVADDEKMVVLRQKDEALGQVQRLQQELIRLSGGPHLHAIKRMADLDKLPPQQLQQTRDQLQADLDTVNKIIYQKAQRKV